MNCILVRRKSFPFHSFDPSSLCYRLTKNTEKNATLKNILLLNVITISNKWMHSKILNCHIFLQMLLNVANRCFQEKAFHKFK